MSSLNPVRALSVAVVAVGIALVSAHGAPQVEASLAISPGTYDRTLEHGGITRRYVVHVPPQHDHGAPLPLVFALHGNGGFEVRPGSGQIGPPGLGPIEQRVGRGTHHRGLASRPDGDCALRIVEQPAAPA